MKFVSAITGTDCSTCPYTYIDKIIHLLTSASQPSFFFLTLENCSRLFILIKDIKFTDTSQILTGACRPLFDCLPVVLPVLVWPVVSPFTSSLCSPVRHASSTTVTPACRHVSAARRSLLFGTRQQAVNKLTVNSKSHTKIHCDFCQYLFK